MKFKSGDKVRIVKINDDIGIDNQLFLEYIKDKEYTVKEFSNNYYGGSYYIQNKHYGNWYIKEDMMEFFHNKKCNKPEWF